MFTNWQMMSAFVGAIALAPAYLLAQEAAVPGVPVTLTVTYEAQKGDTKPLLPEHLEVRESKQQRKIAGLTPAATVPMQLLILVDDSARSSFGSQIESLKQYVKSLPTDTEVAIGYMRNGTNQMVSPFTRDHIAAAKTVRLPMGMGGADVSPYDSLADAVKNWPEKQAQRKEVILISSGVEGLGGGFTPDNPYVNRGIESAQKAGVVVYCIYNPSVGSGRSFWRGTWGQNFLSQLADETGGEAYNINMGTPVSIDPFLEQISTQFQRQYILTFDAKAENKADLRPVKISLQKRDGNVAAASKVFVRAGK